MFAMINTNANSYQVNQGTQAQSAAQQTARTQNTGVNRAAIEKKVETRLEAGAKSEVKREQAGKSAAEEMRRENTAITEKPEDGIQLEISKKGLEKEQQAAREKNQNGQIRPDEDKNKVAQNDDRTKVAQRDEKSATEQRVEEQQKVREKIREQVKAETDDEEQEIRQTEKRDETRQERLKAEQKDQQEKEARQQNITNFAGYTNAQLQQMAQRGDISQNDYRTEIKNREEKLEETEQSMNKTDREITTNAYRADRVERDMNAINTAFSEESNNNINAETRAQVLQDLENPQETRTQQENAQREQQTRDFARWQNDFGFLIR